VDATQIKRLLEDKGLSQVDVAARIGVTPQAVQEIIAGRTTSRTARFAFAAAIGGTPTAFGRASPLRPSRRSREEGDAEVRLLRQGRGVHNP
jgi:transcriptional regulator with XRE-family HTH domain